MKISGDMLFRVVATSCVFSMICLAGCAPVPPPRVQAPAGAAASAQSGGITLSLELPRYIYRVGDQVPVTIRATNITDHPIYVVSDGRDLVRAVVYQHLTIGWERVKQYPALAEPVRVPWSLPPHGQRVWQLLLPVEPDWPMGEQMMLKAEINNGPAIRPGVPIQIYPQHVTSSND
jgi:hypothetical protein